MIVMPSDVLAALGTGGVAADAGLEEALDTQVEKMLNEGGN